jgi:hypothetical protein
MDPEFWTGVIHRSLRRGLTPLDAWRDEIAPRIGFQYPMINLPSHVETRKTMANKLRAVGKAIRICINPEFKHPNLERTLHRLTICIWSSMRHIIRETEHLLENI